jgi:hypothetical protein
VINALMLLADLLGLRPCSTWAGGRAGFWHRRSSGAIIVSIISFVLNAFIPDRDDQRGAA